MYLASEQRWQKQQETATMNRKERRAATKVKRKKKHDLVKSFRIKLDGFAFDESGKKVKLDDIFKSIPPDETTFDEDGNPIQTWQLF